MKSLVKNWFTSNYPEIHNRMKNCLHYHSNGMPNPYHLENDVWTHTEMVMDLCKEDINHIFAGLLHDLGKLDTRYEKKSGRVAFYYHENVSMVKSIDILQNAAKTFDIDILLILQLIAWHGTLWNKSPVSEKIPTLNLQYGHQPKLLTELIAFVEADAYGRDFADSAMSDLNFIDDQFGHLNQFIPFNKQEFKEKRDREAVFMVGVSGSGKSTYIDKHFNKNDYVVVSVDNYFYNKGGNVDYHNYKKHIKKAVAKAMDDLLNAVKKRKNILIDMTNLGKDLRGKKLVKIPSTQYTTKAVVFLSGEERIYDNLEKRGHRKLSKDIIEKQIAQFELPNFDEFDQIEYLLN